MKLLVLVCILALTQLADGQGRGGFSSLMAKLRRRLGRRRPVSRTGFFAQKPKCKPNYKTEFDWNQGYLCEHTIDEQCAQGVSYFPDRDTYEKTCDETVINDLIDLALEKKEHATIREQLEAFSYYYNMTDIYPSTNGCEMCPNNIQQIRRVNLTIGDTSTLCHVMHPRKQYIAYNTCSGQAPVIHGKEPKTVRQMLENYYLCVPDSSITLNVWVYCPFWPKQCIQTELVLPLTCSAIQFGCKRGRRG